MLIKEEKDMNEEEKAIEKKHQIACISNMKIDEQARNTWFNCLSKCLIGVNLFPLAIKLPENVAFYDRLRMFILETCINRFNSFTTPRNGE